MSSLYRGFLFFFRPMQRVLRDFIEQFGNGRQDVGNNDHVTRDLTPVVRQHGHDSFVGLHVVERGNLQLLELLHNEYGWC